MLRRVLSSLLTIVFITVWFIWFRPLVFGGPASYIIVSGSSMEPTYFTDDLVVLQRQQSYEVGDVIAFHARGGNVIHRIINVTPDGYVLQGDNKEHPDPWTPTNDEVLGKAWLHIPGGGRWLLTLKQPLTLALFIAAVTFVIIGFGGEDSPERLATGNAPPLMPMWRLRGRPGRETPVTAREGN